MNIPLECQSSIDKSTWGDGPWQQEPDRADWEHAGLSCLAVRQPMHGAWCGYVAVPPGHPLHGKHYDDVDLDAHGGLTYSNKCDGDICHVPRPGESENAWWFGFDCMHYNDYAPALAKEMEAASIKYPFNTSIYRTLGYVKAETNNLAEQLNSAKNQSTSNNEK